MWGHSKVGPFVNSNAFKLTNTYQSFAMTQATKTQMWMATAVAVQSIPPQRHTPAHVTGDSSLQWKIQQPGIREENYLALSILSSHWFLGKGISQESNHINVSNYVRWSHSFENSEEIDHRSPYLPNCISIVDSADDFISSISSEPGSLLRELWRVLKSQSDP